MFSPEFMKYLMNYQKDEFAPQNAKKEIPFNDKNRGKLVKVFVPITK